MLKNNKLKIKAKVPVISVGNISFGGTGKTPFVIYLCKLLKELNHKPAVIGRGYKRKSKEDVVVSDGINILADVETGGDEMVLIAKNSVPVFAGTSKSNVVEKMNNNDCLINYSYNFDCIIVDDGFQHKKLHRDIDIVLVDKKSITDFIKREPIKSLKRADIIVCTNDLTESDITKYKIQLQNIITVKKNNNTTFNLFTKNDNKTSNDKVIALTGIANPNRFINTLNYDTIYPVKYPDHHYYTDKNITKIINKAKQNNCETVVTTEKDAVKLIKFKEIFEKNNIKIIVFPIEIKITKEDENKLKKILEKIFISNE